jgi:hypothetical protein
MSGVPPQSEWHLTETYKALITLSVEALKLLALVNGGAAVAVLTYLGNLVSHTPPGTHPPNVRPALLWYCGGLFATTLAFVVAYITQLRLFNEEKNRRQAPVREFHRIGVYSGILLALFAAVAFGMGCYSAARALGSWG